MGQPFAMPSFAGGELDPLLHGRVDVDRYHISLASCLNWRVKKGGSLENRSGHLFIGRAKYGDRTTVFFELERDAQTAFVIEAGDLYFRFWRNRVPIMQGTTTAASGMRHLIGAPYVWHASSHPGLWYLTTTLGGPPLIYGKPSIVKLYNPSFADVTLPEAPIASLSGAGWAWGDVDGIGFDALYVADASADLNSELLSGHRIAIPGQLEVVTPYAHADLAKMRIAGSADKLFLFNDGYPTAELAHVTDFVWTYTVSDFNGQSDPVDTYNFTSAYPKGSSGSQQWVIQYSVTRVDEGGVESAVRSVYILSSDLPDSSTPPPVGTLGPVWTLESTSQGDARNIKINPSDYEWINAFDYSAEVVWNRSLISDPTSKVQYWFLARKGTGLDGPGHGGTNLAEDPGLFDNIDQVGPVMVWDVTNPASPIGVTRMQKDALGIPHLKYGYANGGEWGFGISDEIRYDTGASGIVSFPTLWMATGEDYGGGTTPAPSARTFELTLEVDSGYKLYRRYAKIVGIDGHSQGGSWFPWGRLAEIEAFGGTLYVAPNRTTYANPTTQLPQIVGAYKDIGQVTPDTAQQPPERVNDFNDPGEYPAAGGFLGQRLALAGATSKPNRIQLSKTGEFYNFQKPSTVADDSPIDRSLTTANQILYVVDAGNGSGILFTGGSEWRVFSPNGVISPLTLNATEVSREGCANLTPLKVGSKILYVTKLGRTVNAMNFELAKDSFVSTEISAASGHLIRESQFVAWAFAGVPDKTVYAVRADGALVGITFDEDQQMNAWHRHATAKGQYKWVGRTRNGSVDDVYFLVQREINGETVQYLEVLDMRVWARQELAVFADCSLTLEQPFYAASLLELFSGSTRVTCADFARFAAGDEIVFANVVGEHADTLNGVRAKVVSSSSGYVGLGNLIDGAPLDFVDDPIETTFSLRRLARTLWGLEHLEGETVAVVGDGRDLGDFVVSGARIVLPTGVADAVVGYAIDGQVDTLAFSGAAGADTLNGSKRGVERIVVLFNQSAGVEIGPKLDELVEFKPEDATNPNLPVPLLSGECSVFPFNDLRAGEIFVRTRRPFPAGILSITPEFHVGR